MLIRRAVVEDAASVLAVARSVLLQNGAPVSQGFLRNHYTEEQYANKLGKSRLCYVAEENSEVVAFLVAFPSALLRPCNGAEEWVRESAKEFVYVSQVAVRPGHTGKGIGTRLYETLLRETGDKMLLLTVSCEPPNKPSARFHNKMGFKKVHETTEQDGTKWWVYEKE